MQQPNSVILERREAIQRAKDARIVQKHGERRHPQTWRVYTYSEARRNGFDWDSMLKC